MTNLTNFLIARIAEERDLWALAREAKLGFVALTTDHPAIPPQGFGDRMVAHCEAKRRIVERCSAVDYAMPSTHLAHGILAELALPYADHPDYREAWKP